MVETVNSVAALKRHSSRLRRTLYEVSAKPTAIVALSHLADLDESTRQLEALLLFHAEAVLIAEEGEQCEKGDEWKGP